MRIGHEPALDVDKTAVAPESSWVPIAPASAPDGMWDVGDCWNAAAPMESQSSCICLLRIADGAVNDFPPLYPPGPQQEGGGELGSNHGRPTLVRATLAANSKNISATFASNGF
jgi:hypothetical protein